MESGMKQRATCSMQHAEWRVQSAECSAALRSVATLSWSRWLFSLFIRRAARNGKTVLA